MATGHVNYRGKPDNPDAVTTQARFSVGHPGSLNLNSYSQYVPESHYFHQGDSGSRAQPAAGVWQGHGCGVQRVNTVFRCQRQQRL